MNRPVPEHTIAHRRRMDRVHALWKSGVAAILEVTGSRPPYHGRHDVRAGITVLSREGECHPDNGRGISCAESPSLIGALWSPSGIVPVGTLTPAAKVRKGPE